MEILTLHGAGAAPFLDDLARLRIAVFREYPYLYEGDLTYEQGYLADYFSTPESVLVIARDPADGRVVGASTAMPLATADDAFIAPLANAGHDISTIHYFGESVLLPGYRGRGIGHRFFDERENTARQAGFTTTAFCAVVRPPDHPLRPPDYHPHDTFWKKRGYLPHLELLVHLDWREVGSTDETPHQLAYWMRMSRL
jgi:GNAT superfamily N-acetyltransferase